MLLLQGYLEGVQHSDFLNGFGKSNTKLKVSVPQGIPI